jgi:hypothetical protein
MLLVAMSYLSMVIDDFNARRACLSPYEAHAPLVIDANAVLPCPIPAQSFQSVTRRRSQVSQLHRIVQHLQLPLCNVLDVPKPPEAFPRVNCLGVGAPE